MNNPLKIYFSALSFQSRIPIPQSWCNVNQEQWAKTPWAYPLVALTLGIFLVITAIFNQTYFPSFLGSAILVAFYTWLSGGLHLDGLADTWDGFGSNQKKERTLEIMKDSRSGVMGVIVIVLNLLLKLGIFYSFYDTHTLALIVFLMPLFGRNSLICGMNFNPYARENGTGKALWIKSKMLFAWSFLILIIILYFLTSLIQPEIQNQILIHTSIFGDLAVRFNLFDTKIFAIVLSGIALIAHLFINLYWASYCKAKIGGGTGDTLGAGAEISEIVFGILFAFLLL